jgi:adenylate cyclase
MSDVFISYARSTATQAQIAAGALRSLGYSVWLDDDLPAHRAYTHVIEEELRAAKAVVVIWSAEATRSEWVLSEANRAREDHKLVQLAVDDAKLPMPFDQIQCAELIGWSGDLSTSGWRKVLASVGDLAGGANIAKALGADRAPPVSSKPSIAVLRFANLSNDPEQEYFADGMMGEILTALTRVRSIVVVAGGSRLTLKGKAESPQEVLRRLGVRYVLEGSVRKSGQRVRIAVELVDAREGVQMWAERFDGSLEDVFALQDAVADAVAGQIVPAVEAAEARRGSSRPTEDLTAHDLYLRARHLTRGPVEEKWAQALDFLNEAIGRDPNYALVLAYASFGHALFALYGWSRDPASSRKMASEAARRALELAPDDPEILHFAGYANFLVGGDATTADAMIERALALNSGSSDAWLHSGWVKTYTGRPQQALGCFETAMRLDPRSPWGPLALAGVGWCRLFLRQYEEAIPPLMESVELYPQTGALIALAASLAHSGRTGEAKAALDGAQSTATQGLLGMISDRACREVMRTGLALAAAG